MSLFRQLHNRARAVLKSLREYKTQMGESTRYSHAYVVVLTVSLETDRFGMDALLKNHH